MRLLRLYVMRTPQFWLRPLIIVSVLLVSSALVFVATRSQLTLVLLLLLGIGVCLSFLRWPWLGIIVASMAGLVVPFTGPSGLNVTMLLVALLLGLWLLEMVAQRRQLYLVPSRTVRPLVAFLVIGCLSFGVGQLPWFTFAVHAPLNAQLGGLSLLVLSVGTFFLVGNQVRHLSALRNITWAFLAFGALYIVIRSVLPVVGLPTRDALQSVGGAYYVWVVAMAFSQAAFNRDLHPGWRLALGVLVLVTLYVLYVLKYADKSGWVPALVCLAVVVGSRSWRAGLVLVLILGVFAAYQVPDVLASDEYSVSTRLDAWLIMIEIIKVSPIWGFGFANYYWYAPLFPIRGFAVSFNSHNNYVDIVAQTGLVGLACFLWFFWEVGQLGWRLRERVPAGFAQAYVYGALGGLAGTIVLGMFGDWVLPFVYNIGLSGFRSSMLVWLFLGGLVTLERMQTSALARN
jgi:hypothetical protein